MNYFKSSITSIVLLLIFLIPTTSHSEIDSLWAKVYDYCEEMHTYGSLSNTNDGNYLMLPSCGPNLGGNTMTHDYSGAIIKINSEGDTLWTNYVNLWDGYDTFNRGFIEFDNGEFLFASTILYPNYNGYPVLIRTDSFGDTLWTKHFYSDSTNDMWISSPINNQGNNYFYCGGTNFGSNNYNGLIVEIDVTNGDSLMQRFYGDSTSQFFSYLYKLDDGSFIAGGRQTDSNDDEDFWLVKLDESLNVVWEKTYGGEEEDNLYQLLVNRNGDYTMVGRTESFGEGGQDGYVVRTDSDGTVLWDTTFGGVDTDRFYDVVETVDNNLLLAGWSNSYGDQAYWVVKINESGALIDERLFDSQYNDKGTGIIATSYDEFIIYGLRYHGGYEEPTDTWLVKFSTDVNTAVVEVENEQAYIIDGVVNNIVYPLAADTVKVSIVLEQLYVDSASALGLDIAGIIDDLTLIDIDTSGSLVNQLNWSYVINDTNDTLITGFYGAEPLTESGTLFHLEIAVNDSASQGNYPIEIVDFQIDENEQDFVKIPGGIYVTHYTLGDVSRNGELSYYDAAMILKHLVGYINLDDLQVDLADASYNGEVSALDASIVAQYVAQLSVDIPPTDNSSLLTTSEFGGFDDAEFYPGQTLEVELLINQCTNLLSFELEIEYDGSIMSFEQSVWESPYDDFTIEENNEDGLLRIAGFSGSGSENGNLVKLHFTVAETFDGEEIEVTVTKYRLNENVEGVNIVGVFTKSAMGIESDLIPGQYALHQNYPNPFNPTTQIKYDLPEDAMVSITIYDMMGRIVSNLVSSQQNVGYKSIQWNATNNAGQPVSAGLYLYTIEAGKFRQTKKMVLLK
jgi:hypothetical protein